MIDKIKPTQLKETILTWPQVKQLERIIGNVAKITLKADKIILELDKIVLKLEK